jgi:hypothetical protein
MGILMGQQLHISRPVIIALWGDTVGIATMVDSPAPKGHAAARRLEVQLCRLTQAVNIGFTCS